MFKSCRFVRDSFIKAVQSPSLHLHQHSQVTQPLAIKRNMATTISRSSKAQTVTETEIPVQSRLSSPMPVGTWDSHTHVIQPDFDRFPLVATAEYKPHAHTVADAMTYYRNTSGLGITQPKMVLTQVSIYGKDNSAMLEGLAELEPENGRALVEMDPTPGVVSRAELDRWHKLGVRGARVNLVSVSRDLNEDQLRQELEAYAAVVRSMPNWVLELYVPLHYMDMLTNIVPELGIKVVVDHFGGLMYKNIPGHKTGVPVDPYSLTGFSSLIQLLSGGNTWCKISGFYRVTQDIPEMKDLEPLGRELIKHAPNRVVWASDWPHTRFEVIDSVPFVEMCYKWCDEVDGGKQGETREKLFRKNAEELWDVR